MDTLVNGLRATCAGSAPVRTQFARLGNPHRVGQFGTQHHQTAPHTPLQKTATIADILCDEVPLLSPM